MALNRSRGRYVALIAAVALVVGMLPVQTLAATHVPQAPLAAGTGPKGVAVGDVDGNGLNDVVVADYRGRSFSVLYQNTAGTLDASVETTLPWPSSPASVQTKDVTGDGVDDVLVGDPFTQRIWVYAYRNGTLVWLYWLPGFANGSAAGGPVAPLFDFAAGNLNLDDDADLLVPQFYMSKPEDNGGVLQYLQVRRSDASSLTAVAVTGLESGVMAVSDRPGTMMLTQNLGDDFLPVYTPFGRLNAVDFYSRLDGWAVGDNGLIVESHDGGFFWTHYQMQGFSQDLRDVARFSEDVGYACGDNGALLYVSSGEWATPPETSTAQPLYGVATDGMIGVAVGANGVAVGMQSTNNRVEDAGTTSRLNDVAYSPTTGEFVAVGTTGTVTRRVSADSWTAGSAGASTLNAVAFRDDGFGLIVGDGGAIYESSDGGRNWAPSVTAPGTGIALRAIAFDDTGLAYVFGDFGLVMVTDGVSWDVRAVNLPGWWPGRVSYATKHNPFSGAIGDLNGDGFPDWGAIGWSGGTNVPIYLGGVFYPGASWVDIKLPQPGLGDTLRDMEIADLNGDSLNDVVAVSYTGGKIAVSYQNSLGFLPGEVPATLLPTSEATNGAPVSVAIGDLTGDGLNDVAIANSFNSGDIDNYKPTGTVGVYKQTQDGRLSFVGEFDVGRQPAAVVIADLFPDPFGEPENEIVVTNSVGNTVQVLDYALPLPPKITSATHLPSTYSSSVQAVFDLDKPADYDGIDGFYWTVDRTPGTVPTSGAQFTNVAQLTVNMSALAQQRSEDVTGTWYLHVVSRDAIGNIGTQAGEYTFLIDNVGPTAPTPDDAIAGWAAEPTRRFDWAASTDALSGFSRYWIAMDSGAETSIPVNTYTYSGLSDGTHTFKVRAQDRAGNFSAWGTHQALVDVEAPYNVAVTAPGRDGTLIGGTYVVKANASDKAGVSSVQFFVDGNLKATDGVGPYQWAFDSRTVAAGAHKVSIRVFDKVNHMVAATRTCTVDNVAPAVSSITDAPDPFYPVLRDGYKDNSSVRFYLGESSTVTLQVFNSGGTLIRSLAYAKARGWNSIAWNGRDASNRVRTGTFYYRLVAKDAAGNQKVTSKYPTTIRNYEIVRTSRGSVRVIPR